VTLPLDYARCHSKDCPARHDCQRWRDRGKYGPQTLHMMDGCRNRERFKPVDEAAVLRWTA
jgi:hypothetical protein